MNRQQHWQSIYTEKDVTQVSWFQEHADISLAIIKKHVPNKDARIIDIGAGASPLVDDLLDTGYRNIEVLDISAQALKITKQRLGERKRQVVWRIADILQADLPENSYDVWHDRAVFHFLTQAEDRRRYVQQVLNSLKPGGKVIISTFGPNGPLMCSGLPIVRYDHNRLYNEFGALFRLMEHGEEDHLTPDGSVQKFVYCFCRLQPFVR